MKRPDIKSLEEVRASLELLENFIEMALNCVVLTAADIQNAIYFGNMDNTMPAPTQQLLDSTRRALETVRTSLLAADTNALIASSFTQRAIKRRPEET